MRLSSAVFVMGFLPWSWATMARQLEKKQAAGIDEIPTCAFGCMTTIIPQYCDSFTNLTCICASSDLVTAITPCIYEACNITESLRAQKYQMDACGVKNDKSRQSFYIRQAYVLVFLSTLFVGLRCFSRLKLKVGMGADDWTIIAALCSYILDTVAALLQTKNGFGQHIFYLTPKELTDSLKAFYIGELFYILCAMLTKLSLLLFFMRVFPIRKVILSAWGLFAAVLISHIVFLFLMLFQCMPVQGAWENWKYKSPPIKCLHAYTVVYVAGGFGVVLDAMILAFPLPIIWNLKLAWNKKLHLTVIFCIGIFVVACGSARLPTLKNMKDSSDMSWSQQPVAIWSGLELSVGMICACLPPCRSLAAYLFPRLGFILGGSARQPTPLHPSDEERAPNMGGKCSKKSETAIAMGSFLQLEDSSQSNFGNGIGRVKNEVTVGKV